MVMSKVISAADGGDQDAIMTTVTFEPVSLKKIALPVEHGGWGIVLEPAVLGLAVAPSWAGLAIGLAALLAFLARQPAKLAMNDLRRRRSYPRTRPAIRFALAYGAGAAAMLVASLLAGGWPLLLPLALALPFALLQLLFDANNESREWVAEVSGCAAMGSVGASIAIAGGAPASVAFSLWLLMLCRSIPSVLYVRSRLRLERGKATNIRIPVAASALAILPAIASNALSTVAMVILLGRAAIGLSPWRRPSRAQRIGFAEIGYGLLTVALIATGFAIV
jgi:hypothetical protein